MFFSCRLFFSLFRFAVLKFEATFQHSLVFQQLSGTVCQLSYLLNWCPAVPGEVWHGLVNKSCNSFAMWSLVVFVVVVFNLILNLLFIFESVLAAFGIISVQSYFLQTWLALVHSKFVLFHKVTLPHSQ